MGTLFCLLVFGKSSRSSSKKQRLRLTHLTSIKTKPVSCHYIIKKSHMLGKDIERTKYLGCGKKGQSKLNRMSLISCSQKRKIREQKAEQKRCPWSTGASGSPVPTVEACLWEVPGSARLRPQEQVHATVEGQGPNKRVSSTCFLSAPIQGPGTLDSLSRTALGNPSVVCNRRSQVP